MTGASTGIGYELAKCAAQDGYDLVIAADEAAIEDACLRLQQLGMSVEAVEADLSTIDGVDLLTERIGGRPVALLMANAGRGLGRGFLDQDFAQARKVVDTISSGRSISFSRSANRCGRAAAAASF